jgi:hypothetical protein
MNQEELQQKIAEYYAKLTPEARAVFSSMKWLETLEKISEKYSLTEEKMQILGTETMLVLLSIIHIDEYKYILLDELNLSENNTKKIISDIDDSIFQTIKPELSKTFYQNNKPTTEKLEEIIKTKVVKLPKETQEIINSFGWEKISEEIGRKYSLNDEQIKNLKSQIGLILAESVGLEFIVVSIENNLDVNNEEAIKISQDVVNKILKPIAIKLMETIKKSLPVRSIHWQQNLDFILSGGDYTAFIQRIENEKKDEILKTNTFNPSRVNDLKSKFTI